MSLSNQFLLSDKILFAWNYCSYQHIDQKYVDHNGNKLPYINHIGSVVNEIFYLLISSRTVYNKELLLISAILHDTLEDTSSTYEEIKINFGNDVANGVLALTKNDSIKDKNKKMIDSLERIKQQPKEIAIVKMADRIINLQQPPKNWTNEKKIEYHKESIIIYNYLNSSDTLLSDRLLKKIEDYKEFL